MFLNPDESKKKITLKNDLKASNGRIKGNNRVKKEKFSRSSTIKKNKSKKLSVCWRKKKCHAAYNKY